ncbi:MULTISPECIES: hypothetical protein [Aeromonas]|uniref:hypothetical protein n=1 Tax=Aeromonas TaxID=642 RepID=UPI00192011D7|nr:hypothetical protein [Aeromonas caviae]MBL0517521.1 hypothetical protein [Aeromonas caviae]
MAKKMNSAARLLTILERVKTNTEGSTALDIWANYFEISEKNQIKKSVVTSSLLQAMHTELELALSQLSRTSISKSLYETHFSRIENAISPLLLAHQWGQVKQYLTPEVMTALAFCSEILPDEEQEISEGEIESINSKVEELINLLTDADIPLRLRSLIENHISLIQKSLYEYQIAGAKSFRKAAREALGEIIEVREKFTDNKDIPVVSKLEETWKKINSATDVALKAEKVVQIGQKTWDAISNLLT